MIEYLYNAIRATAGKQICICAKVVGLDEELITDECSIMLHDIDGSLLYSTIGTYLAETEIWQFDIPADITKGLKGRYWYCLCHKDEDLCFKEPIYFVE